MLPPSLILAPLLLFSHLLAGIGTVVAFRFFSQARNKPNASAQAWMFYRHSEIQKKTERKKERKKKRRIKKTLLRTLLFSLLGFASRDSCRDARRHSEYAAGARWVWPHRLVITAQHQTPNYQLAPEPAPPLPTCPKAQ